jgi:hypothetical protein
VINWWVGQVRQIRLVFAFRLTMLLFVGVGRYVARGAIAGSRAGFKSQCKLGGRQIYDRDARIRFLRLAGVGAEVDGRWLHSFDYTRHAVAHSQAQGYPGDAINWQVTYSGLSGQPELFYHLRAASKPFGDFQVTVRNATGKIIHVESIRSLEATEGPIVDLGGPALENRVLSDRAPRADSKSGPHSDASFGKSIDSHRSYEFRTRGRTAECFPSPRGSTAKHSDRL